MSAAAPGDVLPGSNPATSLIGYLIPDAEALALGLSAAPVTGVDGCACDGYIGFDSSMKFTFNDQSGLAANTYDFVAAAPTGVKAGLSISDEAVLKGLGWHMTGEAGNLFSGTNAPAGVNNPTNTAEPTSLSLFLAGVGAVGWLRRRRMTWWAGCQLQV